MAKKELWPITNWGALGAFLVSVLALLAGTGLVFAGLAFASVAKGDIKRAAAVAYGAMVLSFSAWRIVAWHRRSW